MIAYRETPLQEIKNDVLERAGVRLVVKREDLNHPLVSGNKWWKLKHNLVEALDRNLPLLTFGGAFSNHIFATAAAARELHLRAVGIIRGERIHPLNDTLAFAERQGMQLHFISREQYRKKTELQFLEQLEHQFGKCYHVPEGGTNHLAVKGCEEFALKHLVPLSFDYLMLPVGTGGTMAGIIAAFQSSKEVLGVSVLKNGYFLEDEVANLLENYSGTAYGNWSVLTSYDHGGYAKNTKELLDFVHAMKLRHNLPLDTVYTGKLIWAVLKEAERGRFSRGSTVLALHTGGLQAHY